MTQGDNVHITEELPGDAIKGFRKAGILLLLLIGIFVFRGFVIERAIVDGNSMADTFHDGEVLLSRKFNINEQSLKRFDVVNIKLQGGKNIIKRVIGLPGETIQIVDGYVYINGEPLEGDYGERIVDAGIAADSILLGTDEFFVLGDNRNNSRDSRSIGPVKLEQIIGVNFYRIFPFHRMGAIEAVGTEK